jgi:hypothetical protein
MVDTMEVTEAIFINTPFLQIHGQDLIHQEEVQDLDTEQPVLYTAISVTYMVVMTERGT